MSQQVYMPYLIIYIQRFLGITDYTLLLAGVLIVSSVLSVLAGRPIDRFGKLRCLVPAGSWALRALCSCTLPGASGSSWRRAS